MNNDYEPLLSQLIWFDLTDNVETASMFIFTVSNIVLIEDTSPCAAAAMRESSNVDIDFVCFIFSKHLKHKIFWITNTSHSYYIMFIFPSNMYSKCSKFSHAPNVAYFIKVYRSLTTLIDFKQVMVQKWHLEQGLF